MKKNIFIFLLLTIISCSVKKNKETEKTEPKKEEIAENYVDFIVKQKLSSKDYILQLFNTNDIVIICERAHPEITQYDLFLDIISDKKFINEVGTVCTETGSVNLSNQIEMFINTKFNSDKERYNSVLNISRNLSYHEIWEKYNYTDFLIRLNKINEKLEEKQNVRLKTIDIPFSWDKIRTREEYVQFSNKIYLRDSLMAGNIIQEYKKIKTTKRHKMLVILNYRHAFGSFKYLNGSKPDNTARYIFDKYPNITSNVLLNSYSYLEKKPNLVFHKVNNGIWDLAFKKSSNKNIGFDFIGSPFGKDTFDMFPFKKTNLKYEEVFTGFCFYEPMENHILSMGIPEIFNKDFIKEYKRRVNIITPNKKVNENKIRALNMNNKLDYKTIQKFIEDIE